MVARASRGPLPRRMVGALVPALVPPVGRWPLGPRRVELVGLLRPTELRPVGQLGLGGVDGPRGRQLGAPPRPSIARAKHGRSASAIYDPLTPSASSPGRC